MSGIAGALQTSGANTAYILAGEEIFKSAPRTWQPLAYTQSVGAEAVEVVTPGPAAVVREMTGMPRVTGFREYGHRILVRTYDQDTLEVDRVKVDTDQSGLIAAQLRARLEEVADYWAKPVVDALLANPVGFDGVTLLNDSHPYGPSAGTWDNKTTSNISYTTLKAGILAMVGLRLENGEWANVRPTHIMVSPKWEGEVADLLSTMRIQTTPATGGATIDPSSGAITAAVMRDNWVASRYGIQLIVQPSMYDGTHDDDWLLLDLSKRMAKPMFVGEAIAPAPVVVDAPDSEPVKNRNVYQYYARGSSAIGGFCPYVCYGKLS